MSVRTPSNVRCAGGKNVFNLERSYRVAGLDLSPRMLALARGPNPGREFCEGDMRSVAAGRAFDAMLVDDAIPCMTTRADLRSAFEAARRHLRPGGANGRRP